MYYVTLHYILRYTFSSVALSTINIIIVSLLVVQFKVMRWMWMKWKTMNFMKTQKEIKTYVLVACSKIYYYWSDLVWWRIIIMMVCLMAMTMTPIQFYKSKTRRVKFNLQKMFLSGFEPEKRNNITATSTHLPILLKKNKYTHQPGHSYYNFVNRVSWITLTNNKEEILFVKFTEK